MHYALASRKCLLHDELEYPVHVEMHERLRLARERAGYDSARAGAAAMGVSGDTYTQHENGTRGFTSRAERYARFFRVTPEWLLYGRGEGGVQAAPVPVNRMVPILGDVQAGAWHPVIEQLEPSEEIPIVLPGFETASLFALRVLGHSMNQHYPEGTIVVCCPAAEIGVRDGDHVIVENRRNGLVETTVKEVVQEKAGIALWPRSTDPAFQTPQRFKRGDEGVDDGPAITAVVVSSYVIRPVQRKPMIRV